jgi:hypothetical protein
LERFSEAHIVTENASAAYVGVFCFSCQHPAYAGDLVRKKSNIGSWTGYGRSVSHGRYLKGVLA